MNLSGEVFGGSCHNFYFGGKSTCSQMNSVARARSSAGEHYGDIVGVVGSNPTAPTIYAKWKGISCTLLSYSRKR